MSESTTPTTVNRDGFTDDDVTERQKALRGETTPYDQIIMGIRLHYRQGAKSYLGSHGVPNRMVERFMIEQRLKKAFPTSIVRCEMDAGYHLGVKISVIFPT